MIYSLLYGLNKNNIFQFQWTQTLSNCGLSNFWPNKVLSCSIKAFKQSVQLRLKYHYEKNGMEYITRRHIHKFTISFKHHLAFTIN